MQFFFENLGRYKSIANANINTLWLDFNSLKYALLIQYVYLQYLLWVMNYTIFFKIKYKH